LWLWHTPPVGDLAAQTAWAQLASRAGFVPWFARWYGGVPVGGYSLVTPGLMALIGVRAVGALATVCTGAAAGALLRVGHARRPAWGAAAFGVAATADLYAGRITFAVGGAVALMALVAVERRAAVLAALLAVVASVTSPVAGLFLLVPAGALVLTDARRRRIGLLVIGMVAATAGVVAVVFPVGGREPFAWFVARPALAIPVVAALLPVGRRVRAGLLLAALATFAAFELTSPVGSNVTRLSILVAVPTLVASARLPLTLLLPVSVVLALWPWHQLHDDLVLARLPLAQAVGSAALVGELAHQPDVLDHRVEVVEPATHWPMTILVDHDITVARGWVRQVDEGRNPLLYGRAPLTPTTYRDWLDDNAVAFVALPRDPAPIDFGSASEAALVRSRLPYLTPVWSDPSWTLYAVRAPAPVSGPGAHVVALTDTGATVENDAPVTVTLALRWSPWLVVNGGDVGRAGDLVRLTLTTPGTHRVHAVWRWPWPGLAGGLGFPHVRPLRDVGRQRPVGLIVTGQCSPFEATPPSAG